MTHHVSKKGPDIVLVGDGGVTIASGFGSYADSGDNATIEVTLSEDVFYHVPEDVDDIRYAIKMYQTNTMSYEMMLSF